MVLSVNCINEEYFFQQVFLVWVIFFLTKNIRPLNFRYLPFRGSREWRGQDLVKRQEVMTESGRLAWLHIVPERMRGHEKAFGSAVFLLDHYYSFSHGGCPAPSSSGRKGY
jgi:hypothetical protein